MNLEEQQALEQIKGAMENWEVRLHLVRTFNQGTGIQVEGRELTGRWKKVGPILFPVEGKTLADVLLMLDSMHGGER